VSFHAAILGPPASSHRKRTAPPFALASGGAWRERADFQILGGHFFSINIYGNLWEKSRFMIDQWEIYGKNLWTSMEIYENLWKQSRFW